MGSLTPHERFLFFASSTNARRKLFPAHLSDPNTVAFSHISLSEQIAVLLLLQVSTEELVSLVTPHYKFRRLASVTYGLSLSNKLHLSVLLILLVAIAHIFKLEQADKFSLEQLAATLNLEVFC